MAYYFSAASSQYMEVPVTNLSLSGAITISLWARFSNTNEGKRILAYKNGSAAITMLCYGSKILALSSPGTGIAGIQTGSTFSTGVWYHIAFIFNWASTPIAIYLNNSYSNAASPGIGVNSDSANIDIARRTGTVTYGEMGFSELAIWNANIGSSGVAQLSQGMRPTHVNPQNLKIYVPLVRNIQDVKGGVTITSSGGPTVTTHPRIYS